MKIFPLPLYSQGYTPNNKNNSPLQRINGYIRKKTQRHRTKDIQSYKKTGRQTKNTSSRHLSKKQRK